MRANRKRNTGPELRLRKELFRLGLRYRNNSRIVAGETVVRPDVVFHGRRIAVFVDGCFWHACPIHGNHPRTNASYWSKKLERNRERDRLVSGELREAGWTVLRYWEHQTAAEVGADVLRTFNGSKPD